MDICKQENDRRTKQNINKHTQKIEEEAAIRQHDTGKRERQFQSQFSIIHSKRFTLLFFFVPNWFVGVCVVFSSNHARRHASHPILRSIGWIVCYISWLKSRKCAGTSRKTTMLLFLDQPQMKTKQEKTTTKLTFSCNRFPWQTIFSSFYLHKN